MAAVEGRKWRRRKKEDVQIEGYAIDSVTDLGPSIDRADETFHEYGKDSPSTDVQHNFSSLTMTVLDKFDSNDILSLITGQDPAAAGAKQYRVQDLTSVHVWANVKDQKNTKYIRSWFIAGWSPGMPMPAGDPNAKAQWQMTGNGNLPRVFEGAWVKMKKVASGAGMTITDAPVPVPGETNIYAIGVKVYKSSTKEQDEVDVTAAMVEASGAVHPSEIAKQTTLVYTDVLVYYLQSGTGVWPTVQSSKLY